MSHVAGDIINWTAFAEARSTLGAGFVRIVGYFREDGYKSVAAIEKAMHDRDPRSLVLPAHTLKGEAMQFGADALGELAEDIEVRARRFVELHLEPDEIVPQVAGLRALFEDTLAALDRELSPLVERRRNTGFGRKVEATSSGFGRL